MLFVFPLQLCLGRERDGLVVRQIGPKEIVHSTPPPLLPAISDSLKGRFPTLSSSQPCPGPWDSQPRVDSAPGYLSATGCPTVKWVRGGRGEGEWSRVTARPHRHPRPSSTPLHPASKRLPGRLRIIQDFAVYTAEGLLGSGSWESLQRFKSDPEGSSYPNALSAAHGSPTAPGRRCPGPKCPQAPKALAVPLQESTKKPPSPPSRAVRRERGPESP